jgi:major intracellular serine protease
MIESARLSKIKTSTLPKPETYLTSLEGTLEHLEMMNVYSAHHTTKGQGVVCAVMDTGVDYNHEALKENFEQEKGYDLVRRNNDPYDFEGHGTHVAGIIQAIAPEVLLKAVRVLDENGRGFEADILLGYEYCYQNKIPIINCSFGSSYCSDQERLVVESAKEYGCLIIAAAGNESFGENSPDTISYPAATAGVQAIASVNKNKEHSFFSNMASYMAFASLGEKVMSTLPNNQYGRMTGTSMASPCVAGAFALQLSAHPDLNLSDRILIARARTQTEFAENLKDKEWLRRFGYGIPDCNRWVMGE